MQLGSITRCGSLRDDAVMVEAIVPATLGDRVLGDGHVEIERFFADPEGVFDDESLLDALIEENQD